MKRHENLAFSGKICYTVGMNIYAISDLHLSANAEKPMDVFGGNWEGHFEKIKADWREKVTEEDAVLIAGDISWAMKMDGAMEDLRSLSPLPGKKVFIRGNHDYWWTTRRKMDDYLQSRGFDTLRIIHNSAEPVGDYAVCGTRGWFYDAEQDADRKVLLREVGRLKLSIDAAEKTGKEPVVFLHYPPVMGEAECPEIMDVLRERSIRLCYYGHIHGPGARRTSAKTVDGITLRLVSCDAVGFTPVLVR